MRLATYSQCSTTTRASVVAVAMLIATIFQGTNGTLTLVQHFSPLMQPVVTLIWFGLYLVAFAGLMFVQGINWIFWISRYRFLLVILMFGVVISTLWSIDTETTLQRAIHLIGSSIIAIYLGFMMPLSSILRVFSWVLGFILFASIASVLVLPELGIEHYEGTQVWRGILGNKNTLGFWAATGVLLYLTQLTNTSGFLVKLLYVFMAGVSLTTLYFCHSATSVLALVISGSICLYLFISIRFQLGLIQMSVIAVLMTTLVVMGLLNINTAELVGRSGDLTGRGEVWAQTWKLILQKPLTGYGYGSIWNPNDATIWIQQSLTDFTWVVYHAHNGFLQIASEIGLPLSCIALLMVVQQLIEIFYCQYDRQQLGVLFVLGFVAAFLISNYSEARFLINRELYWIFFLTLPISMLRQVSLVLETDTVDISDTQEIEKPAIPVEYGSAYRPHTNDTDESAPSKIELMEPADIDLGASTEELEILSLESSGEKNADAASPSTESKPDDLDILFENDEAADTLSMSYDPYAQFRIVDSVNDADDEFDRTMESALKNHSVPHIDIVLDDSGDVKDA